MKCLNCGREVKPTWEFQRCGRIMIGHDCDCGYTSYKEWVETTPPIVDSFKDIPEALTKYASCTLTLSDKDIIEFVTDDYASVIAEVCSQIDFDVSFKLTKKGSGAIGVFTRA